MSLLRLSLVLGCTLPVLSKVPTAKAQPFGIEQGSSALNFDGKQAESKFTFYVKPPVIHPSFESYLVTSTPETGICKISGLGETLTNDPYGNQVKSQFGLITEQLTSKYGNSKLFDLLPRSSIWQEPNEWAMSLYKKDRTLDRFWDAEERSTLSHHVKSVTLQAHALNSSDTYVIVSFEFENINRCMDIIKKSGAGAF